MVLQPVLPQEDILVYTVQVSANHTFLYLPVLVGGGFPAPELPFYVLNQKHGSRDQPYKAQANSNLSQTQIALRLQSTWLPLPFPRDDWLVGFLPG